MNWRDKVIVANMGDDTLSIVDPYERTEIKHIFLGAGVGPYDLTATREIDSLLIVQAYDDSLRCMSLLDDTVDMSIFVGRSPNFVALDNVTRKIYISNADSDSISIVNQQELLLTGQIPVGSMPQGIHCHPQMKQLAVSNMNSQDVWLIETQNYEVKKKIQVEGYPSHVLYSKNGDYLYVCCGYLEEQKDDVIVIIDLNSCEISNKIPVGRIPSRMVSTHDEKYLLVTSTGMGELEVVSLAEAGVIKRIKTGGMAHGVVLDAQERYAYVTNRDDGTLSMLEWKNGKKVADIPIGKEPSGLVYI